MGTGRSRSRRGWITLHLSEQVQNVDLIPGATGSPHRVLSKDTTVISGIFKTTLTAVLLIDQKGVEVAVGRAVRQWLLLSSKQKKKDGRLDYRGGSETGKRECLRDVSR